MIGRMVFGLAALFAASAWSAPFVQEFAYTNSLGKTCMVITRGDEFRAVSETGDGYTCQEVAGKWVYSAKAADGSLVPSGIEVGTAYSGEKHLRDVSEKYRVSVSNRYEMFQSKTDRRWKALKLSSAHRPGTFAAPPSHQTLGVVTGVTILVDFPVTNASGQVTGTLWNKSHPGVTVEDVGNMLNAESFVKYGCQSSARKFFENVSNGKFSYVNEIVGPVLLDHPREYYDDPTVPLEDGVKPFINDLMTKIGQDPSYQTAILPKFRNASTNIKYGALTVRGLNIFFAGPSASKWMYGLWAHRWTIWWKNVSFENAAGADVYFYDYQISPVTSYPSIGTFCHENGHMLCDFPDLYDYSSIGSEGAGNFSLMAGGSHMYPPTPVDPYLASFAGWVTPVELTLTDVAQTARLDHNLSDVLRIINPGNSKQYLLIQNRQSSGYDSGFYWNGITIWRCDEDGDNKYPHYITGSRDPYMMNYECAVVQADGLYHLERGMNRGSNTDCWYAGNPSSTYKGIFNDKSLPTAQWNGQTKSRICLTDFSAAGETMTFSYYLTNIVQQYQYTGQPVTPVVVVKYRSRALTAVKDYNVSYSNNVEIGDAAAIVAGTNNFTGKIVLDFQITPAPASSSGPLTCVFGM